ncbi:hypothetical protein [Paenibacillus sp.]|uniref:hypothetical protein n=1 Tax=Paenibacillus sp. TaxID=58172 RepID=UPI002D4BD043|nr:hypothetical protein [Paenibacillus sp.]HZG56042.1 hypothetical protein [Paenibacillus sp.]
MQLNRYDMAIIEQALREAINQGADYHKISTYQSVLGKMQEMYSGDPVAGGMSAAAQDGFRYDYDDRSDLNA